jgi:PAS domain S-box-containing protein
MFAWMVDPARSPSVPDDHASVGTKFWHLPAGASAARLRIGAVLVGLLLTSMVLGPFILYVRGREIRVELRDQVDFIDVSIERTGREIAHGERQLRRFLRDGNASGHDELERTAAGIGDTLAAAERRVPAGRRDWLDAIRELRSLARRWDAAAADLLEAPPISPDALERSLERTGALYDGYREVSARIGESLQAERSTLENRLAELDFARSVMPIPLALLGALVTLYVTRLSVQVSSLLAVSAAERRRLASVLEQMTDPVLVADGDGRIFLANAAAKEQLGITPGLESKQLVEGNLLSVGASPLSVEELPLERSLRGETVRAFTLRALVSGEQREFSASSAPIVDAAGRPQGAVMVLHDVTDRARYEAARVNVEKLSAIATIAERVAHDFGNYLEALGAAAVMVERKESRDDRERGHWAGIIRRTIDESRSVLEALRALAFTSLKRPVLVETDANEVVATAIELARLARPDAAAHCDIVHEQETASPIRASRSELLRSFVNLMTNALDAMPDGGRLQVSVTEQDGAIQVVIADEGVGIAPEDVDRIFELYYTTKQARGSGLGLTTAKEVIVLHGGSIAVESRLGFGTRFTVRLPANRDGRREQAQPSGQASMVHEP